MFAQISNVKSSKSLLNEISIIYSIIFKIQYNYYFSTRLQYLDFSFFFLAHLSLCACQPVTSRILFDP